MTIGKTTEHIERANLDNVKAFFYSFYAPNNCTLVVAGPVKEAEVLRLAEKWFGPIPSRIINRPERTPEPPQKEPRSLTVERPVPLTAVYKSYRMPARSDSGFYAADLITDLLSAGKSSKLYLKLVKELKLATQVSAFTWGLYDPGVLSIDAILAEGQTISAYEDALAQCLEELQQTTPEELQRMQTRVEVSHTFEQVTALNKAMSLAMFDSIGDAELINTLPEKYRAVPLTDIQHQASNILHPDNCTTLYYQPLSA